MYVWAMRDKGSEWMAVRKLSLEGTLPFTPLIEAVCEPHLSRDGKPAKSPHAILGRLATRIGSIGALERTWIDLNNLLRIYSATDVAQLHDLLRALLTVFPQNITPVLRTSTPAVIRERLFDWARVRDCGICIRIEGVTHLENKADEVRTAIADSGLNPSQIDLIFDAQDLPRVVSHEALREYFPVSELARSWTVLGGSFPSSITPMKPDDYEHHRERAEWIAWRDETELETIWRRPQYGDFATQPANYSVSPAFPGSPSIRYTTGDEYIILRGRGGSRTTPVDYSQFIGHAIFLKQQAYYCDVRVTSGDSYVEQIASRTRSTGNLTTWRVASIQRHIQVVAAQVAQYAPQIAHRTQMLHSR